MKYNQSLAEKLQEGPMTVHITLDADLAARAFIGYTPQSAAFARIIHDLMKLPSITQTYATTTSVRVMPSYQRLYLEMEITAAMLPHIAAIPGIDSITPPPLAVAV